ncbi:MAG: helix-turn-helix domain-containing protein [Chloroflexi bacterium]|nr:helix-turn-helix domain-containing protein [Chloroflexota bacterium]
MNKDSKVIKQDDHRQNYMDYKSLNIKDVEQYLGLCHSRVQKILDRKELPSFKIGRRRFVSSIDLTQYICKLRQQGQDG